MNLANKCIRSPTFIFAKKGRSPGFLRKWVDDNMVMYDLWNTPDDIMDYSVFPEIEFYGKFPNITAIFHDFR